MCYVLPICLSANSEPCFYGQDMAQGTTPRRIFGLLGEPGGWSQGSRVRTPQGSVFSSTSGAIIGRLLGHFLAVKACIRPAWCSSGSFRVHTRCTPRCLGGWGCVCGVVEFRLYLGCISVVSPCILGVSPVYPVGTFPARYPVETRGKSLGMGSTLFFPPRYGPGAHPQAVFRHIADDKRQAPDMGSEGGGKCACK